MFFSHLKKNFSKRFNGPKYDRIYPAARTYQPEYHEYLMKKIYEANKKVKPFFDQHHKLKWMSKFSEHKCEHIANNLAEVWNRWVEIKDLPVAELADTLRAKFMELYARRRKIGEKFQGRIMLQAVAN